MCLLQGVEATVFGMLMSLHIASFNTGKVFGSLLTTAFGVTSTDFTNLAPLVLVRLWFVWTIRYTQWNTVSEGKAVSLHASLMQRALFLEVISTHDVVLLQQTAI